MDGLEATRRIKTDPRGKETAIVVLTAGALDNDREAVFQSGADGFLAKPCREEQLLETIRSLLNLVYDYEEMSGADDEPVAAVAALSAVRLGKLPRELLEELMHATSDGDKTLLNELILKVVKTAGAEFANTLQMLANNYEYDTLTRSLEEALRQ
jgi:DNA-binding response OmpR family regulator